MQRREGIANLRQRGWRPATAVVAALAAMLWCPLHARPGAPALARAWEQRAPRGNLPQAIVVDRRDPHYLYVAEKSGGVVVLKLGPNDRAPARVAVVARKQLGRLDAMNLAERGSRLYVALGNFFTGGSAAGLAILDVSIPEHPRVLSIWMSPTKMKGSAAVVADNRYAYLGAMTQGVLILDVSNPAAPTLVTTFLPGVNFPRPNPTAVQRPNARGLALVGDRLYIADDAGGLRIADVSDRLHPREIGRCVNPAMGTKQQAYNNVAVNGSYAYVAVDYAGLEVLDVSDPAHIQQVGWWNPWHADTPANLWLNSPGHTNQIALDAAHALVYLSAGDSELQVVDVSDPRHPVLAAEHGRPKDGRGTWGLALGDTAVYLADITALIPFHSTWSGLVAVARVR
jgi:hypothetical protein